MTPNDGGPAFPVPGLSNDESFNGMSLRDWFAGQALDYCLNEFGGNSEDMTQYQDAAYRIADAMLAARGGAK